MARWFGFVLPVFMLGCNALKGLTGAEDGGEAGAMVWTPTPASASAATAAPDAAATVTALAPASERVWGVAIDATDLYYSTMSGDQGIRRRPRGGAGGASTLVCKVADAMQSPQTVFVDATHAYVITTSLGSGAVYRARKDAAGGNCEKVATGQFLGSRGIAKIGDTVYVAGGGNNGFILAIDAAGNSRKVMDLPKPADGLATDGTSLFFGSKENMTSVKLMKVAPAGGAPTEIGKGGLGVQFSGGRLYFVGAGLMSAAPSGGEPKALSKPGSISDFAIVGTRVYAGGSAGISDGYVARGAVDGSDLTKYATFKGGLVAMAADDRDVYVTTMQKTLLRISP